MDCSLGPPPVPSFPLPTLSFFPIPEGPQCTIWGERAVLLCMSTQQAQGFRARTHQRNPKAQPVSPSGPPRRRPGSVCWASGNKYSSEQTKASHSRALQCCSSVFHIQCPIFCTKLFVIPLCNPEVKIIDSIIYLQHNFQVGRPH